MFAQTRGYLGSSSYCSRAGKRVPTGLGPEAKRKVSKTPVWAAQGGYPLSQAFPVSVVGQYWPSPPHPRQCRAPPASTHFCSATWGSTGLGESMQRPASMEGLSVKAVPCPIPFPHQVSGRGRNPISTCRLDDTHPVPQKGQDSPPCYYGNSSVPYACKPQGLLSILSPSGLK